jgi:hypothetical protein
VLCRSCNRRRSDLTNLTVVEPSLEEAFLALTTETTTEREAAA